MSKDHLHNIPKALREDFFAHMSAHDFDSFSDGAWFTTLEMAAQEFMDKHKIKGCNNDAAHLYIRMFNERNV